MEIYDDFYLRKNKEHQGFCAVFAILAAIVGLAVIAILCSGCEAFADVRVDLDAIEQIESSGCVQKQGRYEHAVGCFQITAPVVVEWNQFNAKKIKHDDLMDNDLNRRVADWYLNKRIPAMIRHFKKPDTIENRLIAYNAGIAYVKSGKPIPVITKKYLEKYARLTK